MILNGLHCYEQQHQDRAREQKAVEAVEKSAMPRQKDSGVFNPCLAFELGPNEVANGRSDGHRDGHN